MVAVVAGPEEDQEVFHVQKRLLMDSSKFFAAAFGGGFKEAEANKIVLRQDDPGAVRLFIQWVYVGFDENTILADPDDLV